MWCDMMWANRKKTYQSHFWRFLRWSVNRFTSGLVLRWLRTHPPSAYMKRGKSNFDSDECEEIAEASELLAQVISKKTKEGPCQETNLILQRLTWPRKNWENDNAIEGSGKFYAFSCFMCLSAPSVLEYNLSVMMMTREDQVAVGQNYVAWNKRQVYRRRTTQQAGVRKRNVSKYALY